MESPTNTTTASIKTSGTPKSSATDDVRVGIKGFQSLGDVRLSFPVGITAIVGPTDSGKTAIFRAIRALIQNPTTAKTYIKTGETTAAVGLVLPGMPKILWIKTASGVEYRIDGDPKVKLGRSGIYSQIPNFPLIEELDRLMNFHGEWDLLFPFKYTPSELFRLFEDVFDIVDSSAVIKQFRVDEDSYKAKSVAYHDEAQRAQIQLEEIEKWEKGIDKKRIDTLLLELNRVKRDKDQLSQDLSQVERIRLYLEQSKGLKGQDFDLQAVRNAEIMKDDLERESKLYKYLEGTKAIKLISFDLRSMDRALELETDLRKTSSLQSYVESTKDLKESEFKWDIPSQMDSLILDCRNAGGLKVQIEKLDEGEQKLISAQRDWVSELSNFSVCPLCEKPL